jgi:predicted glycoside hydrolase/deacetylase ChbG (UPF0249 family)
MNHFNKIIVNADDFGYSYTVNRAILQSFQRLLINSTSLMANMEGFGDAVGLVHAQRELQGKIGVHLNLTEGAPLSEEIRLCPRFCDAEGQFCYHRERPIFLLSRSEKRAVYGEFSMQLDRVFAAGILPTHLDSHHHVHTEWGIAPIASRLAREYGIRRMRLTRNMGRRGGYAKQLYKVLFNYWHIRRHGSFDRLDYFGDIADMKFLLDTCTPAGKVIEIMVHPLFDEKGGLVDINRKDLRLELLPVFDEGYPISVAQTYHCVS